MAERFPVVAGNIFAHLIPFGARNGRPGKRDPAGGFGGFDALRLCRRGFHQQRLFGADGAAVERTDRNDISRVFFEGRKRRLYPAADNRLDSGNGLRGCFVELALFHAVAAGRGDRIPRKDQCGARGGIKPQTGDRRHQRLRCGLGGKRAAQLRAVDSVVGADLEAVGRLRRQTADGIGGRFRRADIDPLELGVVILPDLIPFCAGNLGKAQICGAVGCAGNDQSAGLLRCGPHGKIGGELGIVVAVVDNGARAHGIDIIRGGLEALERKGSLCCLTDLFLGVGADPVDEIGLGGRDLVPLERQRGVRDLHRLQSVGLRQQVGAGFKLFVGAENRTCIGADAEAVRGVGRELFDGIARFFRRFEHIHPLLVHILLQPVAGGAGHIGPFERERI